MCECVWGRSRLEVLKIVFDAPRNRIDNEISRLSLSARSLLLHCRALSSLRDRYVASSWASAGRVLSAGLLSAGLSAGLALLATTAARGQSGPGSGQGLVRGSESHLPIHYCPSW